jgi:pimeloyl-ACP methyl ester carboxylesterase
LQAIQDSTLVLYGENEIMYSPHEALARLEKIAPGIKAEIIPNAGHDLNFAQAEIMNKKVLRFLKGS